MVARGSAQTHEERDQALIRTYIDAESEGRDGARLREFGTPVWALVAYRDVVKGDMARVAADYDLPRAAVDAAMAYYRRNKALIDARILLNEA